jgi:DNA-binding transcriptional LysR family regulator
MKAMDRLEAMKTFVRVVERGSFSAVAKELGATQSAVSKQVAALETRLGAKLLVRSTRAIALTRAGEAFFPEARRLSEELEAAEAIARANERTLEGSLKVAASVGFGAGRLMPAVRSFLAAHPTLTIELKLDDAFVDLIAEGVDVAVRIGELPDSRLVATKIGESRRLLVASPDYLRFAKPLSEPQDLAAHACILYLGRDAPRRWIFNGPGGARAAIDVASNFRSNSSQAVRAAILSDLGIGFVPEFLVGDDLMRGTLVEPLPAWRGPAQPIHALMPLHRRSSAKARAFVEHLRAFLHGGSGSILLKNSNFLIDHDLRGQ